MAKYTEYSDGQDQGNDIFFTISDHQPSSLKDSPPIYTPAASVASDADATLTYTVHAPIPGRTYVLELAGSDKRLTLAEGKIVTVADENQGNAYWTCVDIDGWIGLRNKASGNFLRHGGPQDILGCSNPKLSLWERLQVRPHEKAVGAHALWMEHWGAWKPVGYVDDDYNVIARMTKAPTLAGKIVAWRFLEVKGLDA